MGRGFFWLVLMSSQISRLVNTLSFRIANCKALRILHQVGLNLDWEGQGASTQTEKCDRSWLLRELGAIFFGKFGFWLYHRILRAISSESQPLARS